MLPILNDRAKPKLILVLLSVINNFQFIHHDLVTLLNIIDPGLCFELIENLFWKDTLNHLFNVSGFWRVAI